MNFPGRHHRKWVFIAIGTVILLVMEHFVPFGPSRSERLPTPAASLSTSAASRTQPSATEVEDYRTALEIPALPSLASPDAAPAYPYTGNLPGPSDSAPQIAEPPAPDAVPQWKKNAVSVALAPGAMKIAIVIDDVGVDVARSRQVLALPAPVTLAFLPYASGVAKMARQARTLGHETLVHMPMEPMNGKLDSGPVTLTQALSPDDFTRILNKNLEAIDGYVGINNHMGSRLTQDPEAMARVMAVLRQRGLLFLDSRTVAQTVGAQVAQAWGVPNAARDVFLDNDPALAAVRESLATLEKIARHRGSAIAIGHPKDDTLSALREWLPTLADKGFTLVPISALVRESAPAQKTLAASPAPALSAREHASP